MRTPRLLRRVGKNREGVALIIVLAFVVLLTGLIVAYFTRALSDRQISNSSANQARVNSFTQGAASTIIDDLKEEIAAGSNVTAVGTAPQTNLYLPATNQSMVPYRIGTTDNLPNLVKRSFYSPDVKLASFFPPAGSANYPQAAVYPPSNRASGVGSDKPSLNGRYVSLARWNKPLFFPPTSTTDLTPSSADFKAPDWILVTRNGNNLPGTTLPTTGATSAISRGNKYTGTPATDGSVVVGRYAYNVYDEGGLLDANVAGHPNSTPKPTPGVTYNYKSSEAFADLTQLGLTSAQVDALVGWRNAASSQATGSFPSFTFNAGSALNYYNYVLGNPTGFIRTYNSGGLYNSQSDHLFSGRQQLISLLTSLPGSTSVPSALQYFGTFSREVNQPSVIPNNPPVLPLANGGNSATGYDKAINPSFLSARVTNAFVRFDGSNAAVGEPLVKKRFALNRLAWITYKGPSANNMSDPVVQQTITNLGGNPGNGPADPVYQFVAQGTAQNIYDYFGLTWLPDPSNAITGQKVNVWVYSHNGTAPLTNMPTSGTAIKTLATSTSAGSVTVAASNRDPDFVELLKASIAAGSKGKTSEDYNKTLPIPGQLFPPYNEQAKSDISLDYQILQIAANIIEQYQPDGYPKTIAYVDANGTTRRFVAVDNLPYIYALHDGVLKLRNQIPVIQPPDKGYPVPNLKVGTPVGGTASTPQGVIQDPGVCAFMVTPEVWNPYDVNSSMGMSGFRPTNFRVVVDSTNPTSINSAAGNYNAIGAQGTDDYRTLTSGNVKAATCIPYYNNGTYGQPNMGATTVQFTVGKAGTGNLITRTMGNTNNEVRMSSPLMKPASSFSQVNLTFSVPVTTGGGVSNLFREPTLLAKAGYPATSKLAMDLGTGLDVTDLQNIQDSNGNKVWTGQGLRSDLVVSNPLGNVGGMDTPATYANPTSGTQDFVGLYFGVAPVIWVGYRFSGQSPSSITNILHSQLMQIISSSTYLNNGKTGYEPAVSYGIQYQDASNQWVQYDTKYTDFFGYPSVPLGVGKIANGNAPQDNSGGLIASTNQASWAIYTDPRTARFSCVPSGGGTPAKGLSSADWLATGPTSDPVMVTDRPDAHSGFGASNKNFITNLTGGWSVDNTYFRPGLLAQNTTVVVDDGVVSNGNTAKPSSGSPGYYSDPDGVVRRAMGGFVPSTNVPANTTVGLPLATTNLTGTGTQNQSRPIILHRPFRSVAELGYVFSDTPWKNLDFFTPESGDASMLDVFCLNDTNDPNELVAGKVNLNTRQKPVLQAILAGAYKNEPDAQTVSATTISAEAQNIATALVNRTSSTANGMGPLTNVRDLTGTWKGNTGSPIDPTKGDFTGFAADLTTIYGTGSNADPSSNNIQRFREAPIRALSATGQTRVWNLMVDVIAQIGKYPAAATGLNNFIVEGEQRYWVHVAIDRLTGQVIDKQIEVVKE